jgi:hypothetical protein
LRHGRYLNSSHPENNRLVVTSKRNRAKAFEAIALTTRFSSP